MRIGGYMEELSIIIVEEAVRDKWTNMEFEVDCIDIDRPGMAAAVAVAAAAAAAIVAVAVTVTVQNPLADVESGLSSAWVEGFAAQM